MIAVAATATEHRPDVVVGGLDLAERDLDVAVGQDAVKVPPQELSDLVEGRQRSPVQRADPGGQQAPRGSLVGCNPRGVSRTNAPHHFGTRILTGAGRDSGA